MKKIIIFSLILCGLFLSVNFASAVYYMQGNFDSYGHYVSSEMVSSPGDIPPMGGAIIIVRPQKTQTEKEDEALKEMMSFLTKEKQNEISLPDISPNNIYSSCIYPNAGSGYTQESQCSAKRASLAARGQLGEQSTTDELQRCQDQVNQYNSELQKYNQCVSDTTQTAKDKINQNIDDAIKRYNANIIIKLNQFCSENYGYSVYDESSQTCKCESKLFWMIGGKCQLGLAVCAEMLGGNVIASTTGEMGCNCMDGYSVQKNSDNKYRCEKIEQPIVPATVVEPPVVAPIISTSTLAPVVKKGIDINKFLPKKTDNVVKTVIAESNPAPISQNVVVEQSAPQVKTSWVKNTITSIYNFFKKSFKF